MKALVMALVTLGSVNGFCSSHQIVQNGLLANVQCQFTAGENQQGDPDGPVERLKAHYTIAFEVVQETEFQQGDVDGPQESITTKYKTPRQITFIESVEMGNSYQLLARRKLQMEKLCRTLKASALRKQKINVYGQYLTEPGDDGSVLVAIAKVSLK